MERGSVVRKVLYKASGNRSRLFFLDSFDCYSGNIAVTPELLLKVADSFFIGSIIDMEITQIIV